VVPAIAEDKCTGCGRCLEVCPPRAITLEGGKARVEEEFCEECGFCAPACPEGAIEIPWPIYCSS